MSSLDSSNHAVLSRTILFKLNNANKGNLHRAKKRLQFDLSDLDDFFVKFDEVCSEEKANLTYKDASLFAHITLCQFSSIEWRNKLKHMAPTKQNRVYIFESFIQDCYVSSKRYKNG